MSENADRGRDFALHRRRYLKTLGAASTALVAGCTDNQGGSTTTANDGGSGTDGGGSSTDTSSSGKKYEGLTINFWDVLNVQSEPAKAAITNAIKQFEQDTGAVIKVNYSGYQQLLGTKWVDAFDRGDYPHIYTSETEWSGRFVAGGWIEPWDIIKSRHSDVIPSDLESAVSWVYQAQRYNGRGYEGDHVWELPLGFLPRTGFLVRTDHFEQAGLDPDQELPFDGYDHAIQVAKTLQQDGPAQYGFHIYGVKWDWFDIAHPWAIAKAGKQPGAFLNEDWSDVNYDKEPWTTTLQQYQNVYQKHGLSGPTTPTAGDEGMVPMLISGKASMAMPEWLNHPVLLQRAPDLMQSGKLRWYPTWKGDSGMMGPIGLWSVGLTRAPEGYDTEKWRREQKAAVDFMTNYLFATGFQAKLQGTLGLVPIRNDVWDQARRNSKWEDGHHMVQTALKMREPTQKLGWEYHPNMTDIMFNRIAPKIVQMLKGNIEPTKVGSEAAKELRNQDLLQHPSNPLDQ